MTEKQKCVAGRIVNITDCLWWFLQLPYVDFVNVATVPKEFRAGIVVEKGQRPQQKFTCIFREAVTVRKDVLQLPQRM